MNRYKILYLTIVFSCAGKVFSQTNTSALEDKEVVLLIATLPEVKAANFDVIKHSRGQRHLITYIDSWPKRGHDYFWVRVAENNGSMLVNHFNFYVDHKTHNIKYYSVLHDESVSLSKWRKIDKSKFY